MDNFYYIDKPCLLDEDELAKKPFSEVVKLVNEIKEITSHIVADLSIHSANIKTINKFLSNNKKHIN
jgi:hypothetical protein